MKPKSLFQIDNHTKSNQQQFESFDLTESVDPEMLKAKKILDVTCGSRGIWFQKNEPHTLYCDRRRCYYEGTFGVHQSKDIIHVDPDVLCDFRKLPFPDNTFHLVVFDPPHIIRQHESENGWLTKKYGLYSSESEAISAVADGICECMRVLVVNGVLIFKWSEVQLSSSEIIKACGYEPLFGHRSGKKSNTHWMTFMKF